MLEATALSDDGSQVSQLLERWQQEKILNNFENTASVDLFFCKTMDVQ